MTAILKNGDETFIVITKRHILAGRNLQGNSKEIGRSGTTTLKRIPGRI